MRNAEQIEKSRLLDFVLHALVGMVAGKGAFADRVEQIRIKRGWIVNDGRLADLVLVIGRILIEIGMHAERNDIAAVAQAGFQCDDFALKIH
jgi:hypothetical protein